MSAGAAAAACSGSGTAVAAPMWNSEDAVRSSLLRFGTHLDTAETHTQDAVFS